VKAKTFGKQKIKYISHRKKNPKPSKLTLNPYFGIETKIVFLSKT
jgi:hypothetical protein